MKHNSRPSATDASAAESPVVAGPPVAEPSVARLHCADARLARFFEIELAHLGIRPAAEEADSLCLIVADGDARPLPDLLEEAAAAGCPLLVFGHDPVELPAGAGAFIRRPFALPELEGVLRRLPSVAPATAAPLTVPSAVMPAPVAVMPASAAVSSATRVTSAEAVSAGAASAKAASAKAASAEAAPLTLAPEGNAALIGDLRVPLTPAEAAILARLLERRDTRPGLAVTREELSTLLGGGGNSVDVYVCHLRRKIEKPLGRRMIATVRGMGYRME